MTLEFIFETDFDKNLDFIEEIERKDYQKVNQNNDHPKEYYPLLSYILLFSIKEILKTNLFEYKQRLEKVNEANEEYVKKLYSISKEREGNDVFNVFKFNFDGKKIKKCVEEDKKMNLFLKTSLESQDSKYFLVLKKELDECYRRYENEMMNI